MLLLKVVSGGQAGAEKVVRRFPVRVGRQTGAHLQLEDAGVWDDHFRIEFQPREGLVLIARTDAVTTLNGVGVREAMVRNGDLIGVGSATIRAWLSPVRQRSGTAREALIWTTIVGVTLAQVFLIYLVA
jgi:hypothetical protein